jgi:hypothetical protein
MSDYKDSSGSGVESSNASTSTEPKYEKPKILLIDLDNKVLTAIKSEGYNVEAGSFGAPYKVTRSDSYVPLIAQLELPPYTEQEIVIIDLMPPDIVDKPSGEKATSDGQNDWWVRCSDGVIDPRPRIMAAVQADFDKILEYSGVFIIFADGRYEQDIKWAHISKNYGFIIESDISFDNWSFLSILDSSHLIIENKHGYEMSVISENYQIVSLLSKYIRRGSYRGTFRPTARYSNSWLTIANNKYGESVAGVTGSSVEDNHGWVFIFPQINNKADFLVQFLNEVLPDLTPKLFPHFEGGRWLHSPEYEISSILELKNRIQQIEDDAKQKINEIEKEIESEKIAFGYLYELLMQTGDELVRAVKRGLEMLGFKNVVDVDEEKEKAGEKGYLREDLQIRDKSPLLLIEVKGINGFPREAQSLQVWKYIAPRMRQLERTDIHGLSVVNHQKNLPALERDNDNPFGDDILTNAEDQHFGLLTTFDLYRLIRSYIKNRWAHEHIEPLFYRSGRISPIPINYELVGAIEHYWDAINVVSIRIESGELNVGDRIAFELPVEFDEQTVESMQIEKTTVNKAEVGALVGIKTHLTKHQAKDKKLRVFRVKL